MLIKFLEKIGNRNHHLLLVHDNTEHAQTIEFEFIKMGLEKNESCVFLVDHDEKIGPIKKKMKKNGIDVNYYENKNQIHIYQIPQLDRNPEGIWMGLKNFVEKILSESPPPHRIVGRIMSDIRNEFSMGVQLTIEKYTHAVFDELNANIICHYDVREIPEQNHDKIIKKLCESHHIIIDIRNNKEIARHLQNIIKV